MNFQSEQIPPRFFPSILSSSFSRTKCLARELGKTALCSIKRRMVYRSNIVTATNRLSGITHLI